MGWLDRRSSMRRRSTPLHDVLDYEGAADSEKQRVPFVTREQVIELLVAAAVGGLLLWIGLRFGLPG